MVVSPGLFRPFSLLQNKARTVRCEKDSPAVPQHDWHFQGMFNHLDVKCVRRGWEVYRTVCTTCHQMARGHGTFRSFTDKIYPLRRVRQFASEYEYSSQDENGNTVMRAGTHADDFVKAYPNDAAARYSNGGALPPDLTFITNMRKDGLDHLYAILTGYRDPPYGVEIRSGLYYNVYFPGGAIAMPPPLEDGAIEYEDGTPATVSQMSSDLVYFFAFMTEPGADRRKLLGTKVLGWMALTLPFAYIYYRNMWSWFVFRRVDYVRPKL